MELFWIFPLIIIVVAIAVFSDNSDKINYFTDRGVVVKTEIENSNSEHEQRFAYLKLSHCQKVIKIEVSAFAWPAYQVGMERLEEVAIKSYMDNIPVVLPSPNGRYTIVE